MATLDERRGFRAQGCLIASQLDQVHGDEAVEDYEGYDLEHDTGKHDVAAHVGDLGRVGGRGDAAPDGLEQEGENVAGDEDVRVELGLDHGVLGPDGADQVLEREVQRSGEERLGGLHVSWLRAEAMER